MTQSHSPTPSPMLSDEAIESIQNIVLKETGVALAPNDPLFITVIINKVILDCYIGQVVEALESILAAANQERQKALPSSVENNSLNEETLNSIQQYLQRDRVRLIEELVPVINENSIQSQPQWFHYLLAGVSGAAIASIISLFVAGFI